MAKARLEPTISYIEAVKYYSEWLHDFTVQYDMSLDEMTTATFVDLYTYIHPGIRVITDGKTHLHYEVDENCAGYLSGAAQRIPDIGQLVSHICAFNVLNGKPLPSAFRNFAFSILQGRGIAAQSRGPKNPENFTLRWLAYEGALFLKDAYNFPLLASSDGREDSACDVVSEVFERFEIEFGAIAIRDWCSHKKYRRFRQRCEILTNFHKDTALAEWGVLKRGPYFVPLA